MKLFVPACGDRIVLTKDWSFTLYLEHRNVKFAKERGFLDKAQPGWHFYEETQHYPARFKRKSVTLVAGTALECDRVYIRSQNKSASTLDSDYDSITWRITGEKNSRFWAKLAECNMIEFELHNDASFKKRAKEKAAQPTKIDVNAIRRALYAATVSNSGLCATLLSLVRHKAEFHYKDSLELHKKAYEMYVKSREADIADKKHKRRFGALFGWPVNEKIDAYYPLVIDDFVREFLCAKNSQCSHSKLKDGTHVRKFWWHVETSFPHSWHESTKLYALAGLSLSVTTDADDATITHIDVCDKRKTK